MINIKRKSECSGCHSCVQICPKECITMANDAEGFLYPHVDKDKCIGCNLCEKVCPIISNVKTENKPKAYAAYNLDEKVRLDSSSGGLFTLLAENVISKGGVVFGCVFNDSLEAVHEAITKKEDIAKMRGSKYVQSTIGNTYKQAKNFLDKGILVLYTGTPCQIEGLLKYLRKDYENLITQDIICHGVPSPLVWQKYVNWQEDNFSSKISNAEFRNKINGWKNYSFSLNFENNSEYLKPFKEDLYFKSFLYNLCLRPSCYDCHFKTVVRASDFTLADFWGINRINRQMNDDKGVSLIFVNSKKGEKIFESLLENINFAEVDIDESIKDNPAMTKSVFLETTRDRFMKYVMKYPFDVAMEKALTVPSIPVRIINKIIREIGKIKN